MKRINTENLRINKNVKQKNHKKKNRKNETKREEKKMQTYTEEICRGRRIKKNHTTGGEKKRKKGKKGKKTYST